MATWKLPTTPAETAPYQFDVPLDGTVYGVELRWNERAGRWFYTILTAEGVVVVAGQPVMNRYPLLRWPDDRLPPGRMFAIAMSDPDIEAGVDELGSRVLLVYDDAGA